MNINGKEFEFDIADVDCMERFEKARNNLLERSENAKAGSTGAENLRIACKIVYDFFDKVLYEGAGEKIFDGKLNFRICLEVCNKFIEECLNELDTLNKKYSKYSPNRAQRRA